jgi:hypothetical protein
MTAQRDSAVNLEISQESKNIAELSRKDNITMQRVALATARDSAAMRIIAAVTILFLPATFVAVRKGVALEFER